MIEKEEDILRNMFAGNRYLCILEEIKRGDIFFLNEEITKVKDDWFLHKCGEELGNAKWFSRITIPTPFHSSKRAKRLYKVEQRLRNIC